MSQTKRAVFTPIIILAVVVALIATIILGGTGTDTGIPVDERSRTSTAPERTETELSSTSTPASAGDSATVPDSQGTPVDGAREPARPVEPIVRGPYVKPPYTTLLYGESHYIGWGAPEGARAELELVQGNTSHGVLTECANMVPVVRDTYCAWTPVKVHEKFGADGYALVLTVYDEQSNVIDTVRSETFRFARASDLLTEPVRNTTFGFLLRYPSYWQVRTIDSSIRTASGAEGLAQSALSSEAVWAEACSTARESCAKRAGEHKAYPTARTSSVGGKQSTMIVTAGSAYVRTDLVERNGIAYFVSRLAADHDGTVHSPYVRTVADTFDLEPSRTVVDTYTYDWSDTVQTLLIERTENVISYVRLYTGTQSCFGEIASGSFEFRDAKQFRFVKNGCTITGRMRSDSTYELEESGCDAFRGAACGFAGDYELQ